MAIPSRPDSSPARPAQQPAKTVLGLALIGLAYIFLLALNRDMLLFPLWSSIAFPVLAVSPFVIFALHMPMRVKLFLVLILLLLLMPFLGLKDSFYLEIATQIGIFAALALGLNIVVGFAGLLDLGYVAFFAVGAYLWAIFSSGADNFVRLAGLTMPAWTFYLFFFGGVILAAITGILLGLPVLRLRGDYLAIVTLGFGEMIRVLASNLDHPVNITNGSQGLENVASPPLPPLLVDILARLNSALNLGITNIQPLAYQMFFYLLVLLICAVVIVIAGRLDDSPIGRAWTAIREDETAAIAMGVPLVRMKLLAFATGASFAGAMGAVFAARQTFVSPESFGFMESIGVLAMVIVGGMGSIRGVMLGAAVVTLLNLQLLKNLSLLINALKNIDWVVPIINYPIRNWPTQLEVAKYERFVFGILLVLMMIFRPAGILPASRRKLEIQESLGEEPPLDIEGPPVEATTAQPGEASHAAGN